jgi:hypothetical protein
MLPSELLAMIRQRPFVPFRIHVTDGTTYDIFHPEMVMPGISSAVIGLPANNAEPYYGRTETIALRHVVRLVPLDSPFAS